MLTKDEIENAIRLLLRKYHAESALLFGSYARNEAREDSDVDLRVDRGTLTGFAYGGFYGDIQRALGVPTDILTTEQLKDNFLQAIRKDEVLLYEKR